MGNPNKTKGIEFLSKIGKIVYKDKIAIARLHTGEIELKLDNKDKNGQIVDLKGIRAQIDLTQVEVDALVGVTEVHAPFYRVSVFLKIYCSCVIFRSLPCTFVKLATLPDITVKRSVTSELKMPQTCPRNRNRCTLFFSDLPLCSERMYTILENL